MTRMHLAAYWGLCEILKLLIDNGNTINVKEASKRIPLSLASKNGHEQVIRVLLENGANIEYKDKYGKLHYSTRFIMDRKVLPMHY